MDKQKSINALQFFVTNLSNQAFGHKLQGKVFADQGFEKLGAKYMGHYDEEMGWDYGYERDDFTREYEECPC